MKTECYFIFRFLERILLIVSKYLKIDFIHGKLSIYNILENIAIINVYLILRDDTDIMYLYFSKAFDAVSYYDILEKTKKKKLRHFFEKKGKYGKILFNRQNCKIDYSYWEI